MQKEVFDNIDTLIKMADSPLNIDDINTELITLNRQIDNKQAEIDELNNAMNDSRYFNAASELVDKNIEISLKNKIMRFNKKIKEFNASLDEVKKRENDIHNDIISLEKSLEASNAYIEALKEKASNAKSNAYYTVMLSKEEKSIKDLKRELKDKKALYETVLKELELTNQARNEVNEELATEKNRLNDVTDNLNNPNAYLDNDLKEKDEEKLNDLKRELDDLEKRKIELLTDANMIGNDAKELIINNDIVGALSKIKELITIVKSKPFMDITNPSILEEELDKKENYQRELSTLIDNKDYENLTNDVINKRVNAIKEIIAKNENEIATHQESINKTDEFINNYLGDFITNSETELLNLEESITEYRSLIKDKTKTSRAKANFENVLSKKVKERETLNNIVNAYKKNLLDSINNSKILSDLVESLEAENSNLKIELDNLNKLSMLDLKTKDLVEEEKDKAKLKAVNEEIKAIKNRQKFNKTPDMIYDEIDMYLATSAKTAPIVESKPVIPEVTKPILEPPVKEEVVPNEAEEFLFEDDTTNNEPRLKVIEMIPVTTVNEAKGA